MELRQVSPMIGSPANIPKVQNSSSASGWTTSWLKGTWIVMPLKGRFTIKGLVRLLQGMKAAVGSFEYGVAPANAQMA